MPLGGNQEGRPDEGAAHESATGLPSAETVRRWVLKFGPAIARRRRPRPSDRWHLDEMVVSVAGERMYLWRAVDDEGEVLDMLVQRRHDSRRCG